MLPSHSRSIDSTSRRLRHRFSRCHVPYPRNYERNVVRARFLPSLIDIVDTLLTIGSGNGMLVVEAVKYWKGCEVVDQSCVYYGW
ncbi:hypothetical protein BDR07DRAFT_1397983 [Suillus spraguei]|nr:hypothetical protein BDR07DRAFT_1397983 [Suillus spraguei]